MDEPRFVPGPKDLTTSSLTIDTPIEIGQGRRKLRQLPVPFVRVLYHGDLSRIGEVTAPELFESKEWTLFGRRSPEFQAPHRVSSQQRALEDRAISRHQFELKWVRAEGGFLVRPSSDARRKLCVVEFSQNQPGTSTLLEISEETFLLPGTLLAVGQRALLLLCHAPWRAYSHVRMGLVGETEPMWRLRSEIAAMARFKRPALVLGETGSGKELVARALCAQSPRSAGPFVTTNCAAIPEQLVESELFGHAKGAFTGATQNKTGLFQRANNGTLFLDEFGELPLALQAKLLRVIQDGLVTPVGSHQNITVDVRLIAATNRDPEMEIESGRLRNDLYYRISAHVVWVPTLAQRRWDVSLLFVHFLEKLREEHPELEWLWADPRDTTATPVPMSFFVGLLRHHWPGNIRELQNIAEQVARLNLQSGGFQLPRLAWLKDEPEDAQTALPKRFPAQRPTGSGQLSDVRLREACQDLGVALKSAKKLLFLDNDASLLEQAGLADFTGLLRERLAQNLFELLLRHDFHLSQTAADLEVSRTTLARLIRGFGLPRPQDLEVSRLQRAYADAKGDLDAMARELRVSPQGLKSHLSRTGLLKLLQTSLSGS